MKRALGELAAAIGLFTRLPVWRLTSAHTQVDFVRSVWAYPVVGAGVGLLGAIAYAAAVQFGLSPMLAALWTLVVQLLLTGALHEDGLADTADGFGGGRTRERKLEIMRDSRIGSYGTLALILSLGLRGVAIATLATPASVAIAMIVAGSFARAAIVILLGTTPPARRDGMASGLTTIPPVPAAIGLALPVLLALCLLPAARVAVIVALTAGLAFGMRTWSTRQIGGHTGDVLGATALATECVLLSLLTV